MSLTNNENKSILDREIGWRFLARMLPFELSYDTSFRARQIWTPIFTNTLPDGLKVNTDLQTTIQHTDIPQLKLSSNLPNIAAIVNQYSVSSTKTSPIHQQCWVTILIIPSNNSAMCCIQSQNLVAVDSKHVPIISNFPLKKIKKLLKLQ